jgi:lipid-A-disaccharide synthase
MEDVLKIMIVAGEASGDGHGAKLVRGIRELRPGLDVSFFGAAGPQMRDEGVVPVVMADELSVVGVAEIGGALPMFLRAMRSLKKAASENRPDVAVLIDFPDFNLKLAKALKKNGIPVVYYISPQLWAWRKYRVNSIRKNVDLMLAILPFEKEWYARNDFANVEYVGSPLAREVHPHRTRAEFCSAHGLDPQEPIVALLPGSRQKEIQRILPELLDSAVEINKKNPLVQFVIALADDRRVAFAEKELSRAGKANAGFPKTVRIVVNETFDALYASDAAAVTSGTATLETGIIGTPMAIVYKTSAMNYAMLKPLISVEHYGLINLIAGERLAAELIQHEFTARTLSDELLRLLEPNANAEMRTKLKAAADKLGEGGASRRAAEAILKLVNRY